MSLRINLNSAAMNASRNLAATDSALGKSIERLSSGYKINRGSDDPAGLVISENLRAQIGGLGQAISNSQDAVNLVKTAEGALTEVHSLLRSMRDLAVHASNSGANDTQSIAADQTQITSAIQSLNNISSRTAFGTKKLLDGTGGQTFTIMKPAVVSSISAASTGSALSGTGAIGLTVSQQATRATLTGDKAYTATTGAADAVGANGTVVINGTTIGTYTTASSKVGDVINDINKMSDTTGVMAEYSGTHVVLTQKNYGSNASIVLGDSGGILNAAAAVTAGKDVLVSAVTVGGVAADLTGSHAFTAGYGNQLKNAAGDVIDLAAGLATGAQTSIASASGTALTFQVGANAGETSSVSIGSTAASALGTGVTGSTFANLGAIDVTTNASDAIKVIDKAISQVSDLRSKLGAFQKNVLESNINSLGVAKENVSASESTIRDADMAAEMVQFTRNNILEQAGTAMLSQANQAPQQLLSLLR